MISVIDNELYCLAFSNLLKILLRIWSCSTILIKSSYDPKGSSQWVFSFQARNIKNLGPQWVISLKLRAPG